MDGRWAIGLHRIVLKNTDRDCISAASTLSIILCILRIVATNDNPHVHRKLVELLTHEVWYVRHSALLVLRSLGGWGNTGILTKVNDVLTDPEKKLDTEDRMEIKQFVMQVYLEFSDPAIQSQKWPTCSSKHVCDPVLQIFS